MPLLAANAVRASRGFCGGPFLPPDMFIGPLVRRQQVEVSLLRPGFLAGNLLAVQDAFEEQCHLNKWLIYESETEMLESSSGRILVSANGER